MAVAGGTMADLKMSQPTWAHEMQSYERAKRHVVDEGLLARPCMANSGGQQKIKERIFDPLCQQYRDNEVESRHRINEESQRISHLNRAADIQVMREQPFNVVNHESRLESLAPGVDPLHLVGKQTVPKNMPSTMLDYHIISNLPSDDHHWAKPGERPHCIVRDPKQRSVVPYLVKDFNAVTNRYHMGHEEKAARESHLNLLEETSKYQKQRKFDPVKQRYNDPHVEDRMCSWEDHMNLPNPVPDQAKLDAIEDKRESERIARFKNRHNTEHNLHAQDVKGDHITQARKLNRIAPERWEETARRGYDVVSNTEFGPGPKRQILHAPYAKHRPGPWEQTQTSSTSRAQPRASSTQPGAEVSLGASASTGRLDRHAQRAEFYATRNAAAAGPAAAPQQQAAALPSRMESPAPSLARSRSEASTLPRSGGHRSPFRHAPSPAELRGSQSFGALTQMPPGMTAPPARAYGAPPAPSIPGSSAGSVFSRPSG